MTFKSQEKFSENFARNMRVDYSWQQEHNDHDCIIDKLCTNSKTFTIKLNSILRLSEYIWGWPIPFGDVGLIEGDITICDDVWP